MDTSLTDKAVIFATKAHSGTPRKGTQMPYITHPMEAMAIVATMTDRQELLAAAALHDVVEDTPVTLEELRHEFGDEVAEWVFYETSPSEEETTWQERKQANIDRLAAAPLEAKMVAIGDKLSNLRAIVRDYRRLGDALWCRFNAPQGGKDVAWYYRGLGEALKDLAGTQPYEEYMALVDRLSFCQ